MSDPFLGALKVEAEQHFGPIRSIEASPTFETGAPYCGSGTCEIEVACVTVNLTDGTKWFQLREFTGWVDANKIGDSVDDWESADEHWCRYHQPTKRGT